MFSSRILHWIPDEILERKLVGDTDGSRILLNADELCGLRGVTPAQRQAWARDGDIRVRRGFEELDVVELTIYSALRDAAGPKRAKVAWRGLRATMQEELLGASPGLRVVIETKGVVHHALVRDDHELAREVERRRPVVVVHVSEKVAAARAAYREAAAAKAPSPVRAIGSAQSLHRGGSA